MYRPLEWSVRYIYVSTLMACGFSSGTDAAPSGGALSDRARAGLVFVVDELVAGDTPSTRQAAARLAAVGDFRRRLVVLDRTDVVSWLSLRNLPGVHVIAADQFVIITDANAPESFVKALRDRNVEVIIAS